MSHVGVRTHTHTKYQRSAITVHIEKHIVLHSAIEKITTPTTMPIYLMLISSVKKYFINNGRYCTMCAYYILGVQLISINE